MFKKIILLVFILCSFLNYSFIFASDLNSIFLTKSSKNIYVGDTFTVEVKINSTKQSMNAVSGIITFPVNYLDVVSISSDRSIINVWTEVPNVKNNQIYFEGVIVNPGFRGTDGVIFRINFKAKKAGTVLLDFKEGSMLANDGFGTNIIENLVSLNFKIIQSIVIPTKINKDTIPQKIQNTEVQHKEKNSVPEIEFTIENKEDKKDSPVETLNNSEKKILYLYYPIEDFTYTINILKFLIVLLILLLVFLLFKLSNFFSK